MRNPDIALLIKRIPRSSAAGQFIISSLAGIEIGMSLHHDACTLDDMLSN